MHPLAQFAPVHCICVKVLLLGAGVVGPGGVGPEPQMFSTKYVASLELKTAEHWLIGLTVSVKEPLQSLEEYALTNRPSVMHTALMEPLLLALMHLFCGSTSDVQFLHLSSVHVSCVKLDPLGPGVGLGAGVVGLGPPATLDVHGRDVMRHWSVPF